MSKSCMNCSKSCKNNNNGFCKEAPFCISKDFSQWENHGTEIKLNEVGSELIESLREDYYA